MLLAHPHHDGSELYISNAAPKLGEMVTLRVRVPRSYAFEQCLVRFYHDGEPRTAPLKLEREEALETWWSVKIKILNPSTAYRFVFVAPGKYEWLNAYGLFDHDVHSNNDFVVVATAANPSWIRSSVFYQIFPDRFAKSGRTYTLPDWAQHREWNDFPAGRINTTGTEVYGGDLYGVAEHLDHIENLGVNGIYFTPFFPSRSNHRYDASSFREVDPLLGGDKALFSLVKKAKAKKIHVMADLTSNHCGAGHSWLAKAQKNKKSKERGYFYWDKSVKHGYVGWWGLASLPKLNFSSQALRNEMYAGKNSIVKQWLRAKYGMSGWRIDVGNMTGREGAEDHHDEVMYGIRQAMHEVNPDAWLVAENGDFVAKDLDGFGWHGAMNYQGFMRPFWNWMNRNPQITGGFQGLPFEMPKITGKQLVASMNEFSASIPWRSLVSSMTFLDTHDTARFRSVVTGDKQAHEAAIAMSLAYPGVPSIFAGDELGLEGIFGEDARRTIDWESQANWDLPFLESVKSLVKIRRTHDAFANGGLRWVAVEDEYLAFLRESKRESILFFISRGPVKAKIDLAPFGLRISSHLAGAKAEGSKISIKSKSAAYGMWIVK
jgi:alpha-glucosidase